MDGLQLHENEVLQMWRWRTDNIQEEDCTLAALQTQAARHRNRLGRTIDEGYAGSHDVPGAHATHASTHKPTPAHATM